MIYAPHSLLRFTELDGYIYHMDVAIYDHLHASPIELELPIVYIEELRSGVDGVRCGYRFRCPQAITRVMPNVLAVCREPTADWEPLVGLPGFQVYTSSTGIVLISTRMTPFLNSLQ